jgi:hypothetical protein
MAFFAKNASTLYSWFFPETELIVFIIPVSEQMDIG